MNLQQILDPWLSLAGTEPETTPLSFFKILIWVQADHGNCMKVPVVLNIFEEKGHLNSQTNTVIIVFDK